MSWNAVHIDDSDDIRIRKTNTPMSHSVINLGDVCDVYLTKSNLVKLKAEIDRILKELALFKA